VGTALEDGLFEGLATLSASVETNVAWLPGGALLAVGQAPAGPSGSGYCLTMAKFTWVLE